MTRRQELVFLDPAEVAVEGRTQINIHEGAIQVGPEGPDWGDYAVDQFKAKRDRGELPIDDSVPNRVIVVPLVVGASGDFDAARIALQAWVGKVNGSGGGWLKREMKGGSYGEAGKKLFADIVKATLHLGDGTSQASNGIDPEAHLELEALPEFYGELINAGTFSGEGTGSELFLIKGNLPARGELTVTDQSGNNQLGAAYAVRPDTASGGEGGAISAVGVDLEAEWLRPLEEASVATVAGASEGKAVRHSGLATTWTPILSLSPKAELESEMGGALAHKGLYDVWARVFTTSDTPPWLRLLYETGVPVAMSDNRQIQIPSANGWYLVPLGQVDLRPGPYGPHQWLGVIQGRGEAGGENVAIDRLFLQCADVASGVLSAARSYAVPAAGYKVRDEFNQSAGALTGKLSGVGSEEYVELGAKLDANDFEVAASHQLKRTALSDSGSLTPTFAGRAVGVPLGFALTDQAAQIDFSWSRYGTNATSSGLILRGNDAANFLRVYYSPLEETEGGVGDASSADGAGRVGIEVMRGGELTAAGEVPIGRVLSGTLTAAIVGNDLVVLLNGQEIPVRGVISDEVRLLPAGGVFIADECQDTVPITREYDNFAVWIPNTDAVIFANRSAKVSHLGMYRQDASGSAYSRVAHPNGDLLRLPASTVGTPRVEVAVRVSRGDFGIVGDPVLDPFEASLAYRPCWSSVPGL